MSAVIHIGNARAMNSIRNAVNARAHAIHADDATRRHAVAVALRAVWNGSSPAWAVAEACRDLRGVSPAAHFSRPTPPEAA